MSHVAMAETQPGKPMFADLECLLKAAELKGLEQVNTNKYTWYNRHVGDWPLPPGVKVEEIGNNAVFILRVKEPKRSEFHDKYGRDPYDVGVLADPNNPGCYTLIYDFYGRGYGVDELVGAPIMGDGNNVKMLCPELKQAYDMVCAAKSAAEAGDQISFMTLKEAHLKRPDLFPASTDEKTWISIATTENRIGIQ